MEGTLFLDAAPPGDECGHCVAVSVSSSGKGSEKGDARLRQEGSSGGGQGIHRGRKWAGPAPHFEPVKLHRRKITL